MTTPVEVTIILKSEDATYRQKFLCYEPLILNVENETMEKFINEAKRNFVCEPDEIQVKAFYTMF